MQFNLTIKKESTKNVTEKNSNPEKCKRKKTGPSLCVCLSMIVEKQ